MKIIQKRNEQKKFTLIHIAYVTDNNKLCLVVIKDDENAVFTHSFCKLCNVIVF